VTEITYRPAGIEDAALAADLMTAAFPREPEDPIVLRYQWEHPRRDWTHQHFIASIGGTPIAFVSVAHFDWASNPERDVWIDNYMDLEHIDHRRMREVWEWAERSATAEGALILNTAAAEEESVLRDVLGELGYEHDRTDKMWNLDLERNGPRLSAEAATARESAMQAGIQFVTLAAFERPDKLKAVYTLDELTRKDIPRTVPRAPESFESWLSRSAPPDRRHDRWWLAVDGDMPVAMSYLRFPPVRGNVWTQYTCCHPDYRGRGLARGVKLQSLAQAIELGVPNVHTDNDSENVAMVHINQTLGYEEIPGFSTYRKRVNK
jgi:RimJ/RimL family protein N-acetyltransferase